MLAFSILTSILHSHEDISKLIDNLDDVDFEVREEATLKLKKFDGTYAKLFLELSDKTTESIEERERLYKIAKYIYKYETVKSDYSYMARFGYFGLTLETFLVPNINMNGFIIDDVREGGPCNGKLKTYDIIVKVDDKGVEDKHWALDDINNSVEPDKNIDLIIYRFKEKVLEDICKHPLDINDHIREALKDSNNYDIKEIKIKSAIRENHMIDWVRVENVRSILWNRFIQGYVETKYGEKSMRAFYILNPENSQAPCVKKYFDKDEEE